MKKNCKLDERQLWIRGEVYKHALMVMGGLLILDAILKDFGMIWADSMSSSMIILMVSIMVGSVEMICRDVYMVPGNRQKYLIALMGICSSIVVVQAVIELAIGKYKFVVEGQLTNDASKAIMVACVFIIFIVFLVKNHQNKKMEVEYDN
ncbi:hypothetical protein [Clostridium sp. DL1XJH146]